MKATTESWILPRSSRTTRGSRPLAAASFSPRSSSPSAFAELLQHKGIRHELDVWGPDWPHDWDSWRAQLATHLTRFV